MIIIASRHHGTARFREAADQLIEVLGFDKQEIFQYVDSFPFDKFIDSSHESDTGGCISHVLKAYLNSHNNILHMCYLPVHCAMLCYLHTQLKQLPDTETKIYECFSKLLLQRKMAADNSTARADSLNDLKGETKVHFEAVCNLAFEMCIKSKQVIHQSEIEAPRFQEDSSVVPSLGFLKIDSVAKLFSFENTYTFHHLTLQEFLAAWHIAKLEKEQQVTLIKKHCNWFHYLYFGGMLWKFYCGLVNFDNKIDQLADILNPGATDNLYPLQCAFQSQQKLACDMAIERFNCQLHIRGHTLTMSDIHALKYVTATTSRPLQALIIKCFRNVFIVKHSTALTDTFQCCKEIEELILCSGDVDAIGAQMLSNVLTCTDLKHFNISRNSIGSAGAVALTKKLKLCKGILKLNFSKTDIGLKGVVALSNAMLSWPNLLELDLSHNDICSDGPNALPHEDIPFPCSHSGMSIIIKEVKNCTDFQSLNLSLFSSAGSDGMNALATGLRHCRNLKILKLQNIGFGITDAAALASGLQFCDDLEELDISYNAFGSPGMKILCTALVKLGFLRDIKMMQNCIGFASFGMDSLAKVLRSCDLYNFDLCNNAISVKGAEELARGLRSCRNLRKLDISDNEISGGAAALSFGLQHCKKLVELDISNNNIENAAVHLAEGLKYCTNLQKLYLKENMIGTTGGTALAAALSHCIHLKLLDLNNNCIGSEGAVAIGNTLKSCRQMHSLELDENAIGTSGAEAISNSFRYCTNIRKLSLCSNNIDARGAVALARGLEYCICLQFLMLDNNCVGDDGAAALVHGLKNCLSLTNIDLASNNISCAGAIALADGLPNHPLALDLMENDIGQDGIKAFSKTKIVLFHSDKKKEEEEEDEKDKTAPIDEKTWASMHTIGAMLGLIDEHAMKKLSILPPP